MTDASLESLHSQLTIYRTNLVDLTYQANVYGGEALAPTAVRNQLRETRAMIAVLKAKLRSVGVAVTDELGELEPPKGSVPPELRRFLHDHTGFMQTRLESFVGREAELAEVRRRVAELLPTGGYVTITGQAGQGKSCLIARLVELELRERCGVQGPITQLAQQAGPAALAYHFIPFSPGREHQVGLLHNLMTRLILKHDLPAIYVASDSYPALRDFFARVLEDIAAKGGQEVICIDGLDQIEEDASGARDLSFLPIKPPEGVVFVLGTRPNDTLQPLELRKPLNKYELPPLSRPDFDLILQHRQVGLDTYLADRFYNVMEANALYLDLVARELAEAGALAPEQIIARIADNPDNLFSLAIERLKRLALEWRTLIKPILGVLLAAQQPLAATSIRVIISQEDEAVRTALMRLGGLLARDGQARYTLFHLKLRDFLREDPQRPDKSHVFATDEEQGYHQRLADWCERDGLACIWQDHPRDAREQERRAYARQSLITHLCRAQHWRRLWEVLDQGEYGRAKLHHDPSTRSFMLDLDTVRQAMAAAMSGDMVEGVAWVPRLWQYSLLRCSLSSQADNYPEGLIELLAQLGREQEAVGLAEVLTDPERTARTLVRIGEVLGQQERESERQQLVARAVEVARGVDDDERRAEALAEVVGALAKARHFEEAHTLAQQIPDEERQATALVQIGQFGEASTLGQQISDEMELAEALVWAMEALAQGGLFGEANALDEQINEMERAEALAGQVMALAQVGQFGKAIALAHQITDEEVRAQALVRVVGALAQAGQFEEASALAQRIRDEERGEALVRVVEAQIEAGQFREASALAQETTNLARRLKDDWERGEALVRVVEAQVEAGQFREASALAHQITDVRLRAEALARLVEAQVEAGQFREASALAHQIADVGLRAQALARLAETQQIRDEEEQTEALAGLVQTLAQAGQFREASALAHQITDEEERAEALVRVVGALAQAGQFREASALAHQITNVRLRAQALAQAGQFKEASALAHQITDVRLRAQALVRVVGALAQAGQFKEASALAHQITDVRLRAQALVRVVEALAQAGQFKEASALAHQITEEWLRAQALVSVVEALAQAGQFGEASALAEQISDEGMRTKTLLDLLGPLMKAGRIEDATRLIQQISDEGRQVETLITIAQRWAEIAAWETVLRVLIKAAALSASEVAQFLSTLPHLPTVLTLVRRLWSQAQTRDDLYALLPAATPLLVADATLLPQILAGEAWVKEQLKW